MAKNMYRNTLKMSPKPETQAKILNNLAFATWMHSMEMQKAVTVPKETQEKTDAIKEEEFVI